MYTYTLYLLYCMYIYTTLHLLYYIIYCGDTIFRSSVSYALLLYTTMQHYYYHYNTYDTMILI